jgi:hypothetical protein
MINWYFSTGQTARDWITNNDGVLRRTSSLPREHLMSAEIAPAEVWRRLSNVDI